MSKIYLFRFCDSVWQLLLKNVEFLSSSGQPIVRVDGKVRLINTILNHVLFITQKVKIVACDARKLDDKR